MHFPRHLASLLLIHLLPTVYHGIFQPHSSLQGAVDDQLTAAASGACAPSPSRINGNTWQAAR